MRVEWKGVSGKAYQAHLESLNSMFEEVAGVYILCKPNQDSGWDGVEAGVTENLRHSITDQVTDLIRRFPNATHVAFIPMDFDADRREALHDLMIAQ